MTPDNPLYPREFERLWNILQWQECPPTKKGQAFAVWELTNKLIGEYHAPFIVAIDNSSSDSEAYITVVRRNSDGTATVVLAEPLPKEPA